MGSLGPTELIIIFGIILLLFGAKKLPELARGLGRGIREFKDATNEITDEIKNADYQSERDLYKQEEQSQDEPEQQVKDQEASEKA
ncbi:MAG TPA: twin-arginine translocase TatA/TatE family subunit [bacterium]|nr:twin-arginine translocase TatA/TatE family subunit [bacterium]